MAPATHTQQTPHSAAPLPTAQLRSCPRPPARHTRPQPCSHVLARPWALRASPCTRTQAQGLQLLNLGLQRRHPLPQGRHYTGIPCLPWLQPANVILLAPLQRLWQGQHSFPARRLRCLSLCRPLLRTALAAGPVTGPVLIGALVAATWGARAGQA